MTSPRTKLTASNRYAARARDITRLMDELENALARHALAAEKHRNNWGGVGDLCNVREGLINLVKFMSGMHRGAIEKFLDE